MIARILFTVLMLTGLVAALGFNNIVMAILGTLLVGLAAMIVACNPDILQDKPSCRR